jgi:phosphoglycerate dehydrogenase-like enzyme
MSDHPRVVSTFGFAPASEAKIREAANGEFIYVKNKDDLLPALRDAEVFCGANVPQNWREVAPRLRWVQFPGAGVDTLRDHPILRADSGILVTTASGVHATNISEYVFCSMMMFNRSWPQMMRYQDRHIWAHAGWAEPGKDYPLRERELHGTTLGIIGLGSIGRHIAQMARAFRMKVLATRFSARTDEQDPDVDQLYPFERFHDMLGQCDYVVIATPLTDKTEKMIDEAALRAMKPNAYLVNIGRGREIDEEALIRALREGWIAGAGLDVTAQEPLPSESPLYDLPNVILTPHISGATEFYEARLADIFADNLRRYRAGQPLRNLYDPTRGY